MKKYVVKVLIVLSVLLAFGGCIFEAKDNDEETGIKVRLLTPEDGATSQDLDLTLTWESNASSFDVYVGTTKPPIIKIANDLENKSYTLKALEDSTKYYWFVRAEQGGDTELSGIRSFTTKRGSSNPKQDGLVAYYPLIVNANDESGNNNHGVAKGGVIFGAMGATFDGVDDYIDIDRRVQNVGTGDFTLSMFVKAPSQAGGTTKYAALWLSHTISHPYTGITMFIGNYGSGSSTKIVARVDANAENEILNRRDMEDSFWHNMVLQRSGTILKLYVDGEHIATQMANSVNVNLATLGIRVGANAGNAKIQNFTGVMKNISFYNKALSQSEITQLYNNGGVPAGKPVLAPSPPEGVIATALSSSQIKLVWRKVAGAANYYIYRSTSFGGTYTKLADEPTESVYTDNGLSANTTYYYMVKAVNSGGKSAYSSVVSAKTKVAIPAVPTGLSATGQSSSQINLAWTSVDGATKYYVYRATSSGGTYTKLTTEPTDSGYTDTGLSANTTYYYKVKAVNSAGESAFSAVASATTSLGAPATPTNLTATGQSSSQINLAWTMVSGASKYYVYRATTSGGTYSKLADEPSDSGYTDTGLSANTTYYYKVKAVNSAGESGFSAVASAKTKAASGGGNSYKGGFGQFDNFRGADATGGAAQFDKLDANGSVLPASATTWYGVKDKITGLMWEVKTDDGGLRDKDNRYTWYNSDATNNGGGAGSNGIGAVDCTQEYVDAVNAAGYLGYSDWRMPTLHELRSIVDYTKYNLAIDTDYFPRVVSSWYWSSSAYAGSTSNAWRLNFSDGYGYDYDDESYYYGYVRLVR